MNNRLPHQGASELWLAIRTLSWLDYCLDPKVMPWGLTIAEGHAMDAEHKRCTEIVIAAGLEPKDVPCRAGSRAGTKRGLKMNARGGEPWARCK